MMTVQCFGNSRCGIRLLPFWGCLLTACLLSPVGVGQCRYPESLFRRLPPEATGVHFINAIKEQANLNFLSHNYLYNGGGVALGDVNNDGRTDIFLTGNQVTSRLYLNQGNLTFKDATESAGLADGDRWASGVTLVDINADGWLDLYVSFSGTDSPERRRNRLYVNQQNGQFRDEAAAYGLDHPGYGTQAVFFDYDRDGDLDAYLLNYNVETIYAQEWERAGAAQDAYAGDKLLRNDDGQFVDVTDSAGIKSTPMGYGLGVAVTDINEDGWPDIYVSNDYGEQDYLYINQGKSAKGEPTFIDQMPHYFQHISHFSMGLDVGDINNDGHADLFTADMLPEDNKRQKLLYGPDNYEEYARMVASGYYHQNMRNMLQLNHGNGPDGHPTFSEIGQLAGVSNTDWSWSPLLADFDNDGYRDLFVSNGYFRDVTNRDYLKFRGDYYFEQALKKEKADTLYMVQNTTSTPVANYIFRNNGDLTFSQQRDCWGLTEKGFSNGAAYADLDNDGDLDLVINNINEPAGIYENRATEFSKNNFLNIRLRDTTRNPAGIGSKVYVYSGGLVQYFEVTTIHGFQSSSSPEVHVGLGQQRRVDSLRVVWPQGQPSILYTIKANRSITVDRPATPKGTRAAATASQPYFVPTEAPFSYTHTEFPTNDFKRQPQLLTMLSTAGPTMAVADVNGDGQDDVFVGGSKGTPGKLFIQTADGGFREGAVRGHDIFSADTDALFFDADRDGDPDLYLVSGGYHDYQPDDPSLRDRLFINDGSGTFTRATDYPALTGSKSCVAAADFDQDGDLDLFVGGRAVPGQYPRPSESFLMVNDGQGHFTNCLPAIAPSWQNAGMVTDAQWSDVNRDGWPDLLVVGEFMPIRVLLNKDGKKLVDATETWFEQPYTGLWSSLTAADFDGDGDEDWLVGNFGLNSQLSASNGQPLTLVYHDFDQNGSVDPITTHYIQGKDYPFASRDEMVDQLFPLRKRFPTYESYSEAQLSDLFSAEELRQAQYQTVNTLASVYLENTGAGFIVRKLPLPLQQAPVFAFTVDDLNADGHLDFVAAGNQSYVRIKLGVIDANYGQLYWGDGQGAFSYVPQKASGLQVKGDVRSAVPMRVEGQRLLLFGINNAPVQTYAPSR